MAGLPNPNLAPGGGPRNPNLGPINPNVAVSRAARIPQQFADRIKRIAVKPNDARDALTLIQKWSGEGFKAKVGAQSQEQLQKEMGQKRQEFHTWLDKVIQDNKTYSPTMRSAACDYRIHILEGEISGLKLQLEAIDNKLAKGGLKPEEVQQLQTFRDEITNRQSEKISHSDDTGHEVKDTREEWKAKYEAARGKILNKDGSKIEDQFMVLAKKIGLNFDATKDNPLTYLTEMVQGLKDHSPGNEALTQLEVLVKDGKLNPTELQMLIDAGSIEEQGRTDFQKKVEKGTKMGLLAMLIAFIMAYISGEYQKNANRATAGAGA